MTLTKVRIDGVDINIDDGTDNNIICYEDGYEEENDKERMDWLKKQLRHYGYKFINEDGITEE